MKIRYGEPFSIPRRLGSELFKEVVRIRGVNYIRGQGFVVSDYYALSSLNRILARLGLILTPEVKCSICGANIDCEKCEFNSVCRKNTDTCVCDVCLKKKDLVEEYIRSQKKALFST
jgi:hypothetical protein